MEAFLIVLGVIIDIVFWYVVAKEFQRIAEMKGHFEKRYFWWTFFVGPVGMLTVIALPDRGGKNTPTEAPAVDDALPEL